MFGHEQGLLCRAKDWPRVVWLAHRSSRPQPRHYKRSQPYPSPRIRSSCECSNRQRAQTFSSLPSCSTPTMSSSDPHMLISSCAKDVRELVARERHLKAYISAPIHNMDRIDASLRTKDGDKWGKLVQVCTPSSSCLRRTVLRSWKDYKNIAEESKHSATKLAATITGSYTRVMV